MQTNERQHMQINHGQKGKVAQAQSQQRRRRRKLPPPPPGQMSDAEMIAAHIAKHGIKQCDPGYAMGALKSTAYGLES